MSAIGELSAVLLAGLREGDLPGHLRVWRQVMKGEITPEQRTMVFIPQGIKDGRTAAACAIRVLRSIAGELRALELSDRPVPATMDPRLCILDFAIEELAGIWELRGAAITNRLPPRKPWEPKNRMFQKEGVR